MTNSKHIVRTQLTEWTHNGHNYSRYARGNHSVIIHHPVGGGNWGVEAYEIDAQGRESLYSSDCPLDRVLWWLRCGATGVA